MKTKLAILVSGGGMKASFCVGVLLALEKKYKITSPHILICGSGSAGTGAYYVAKQYTAIYNVWAQFLCSKKFLNILRFWKIIDVDYLIDDIFMKQEPLNTRKVRTAKTKFFVSALDTATGKIAYFDMQKQAAPLENLRAAKAIPLAYKWFPAIHIEGRTYQDSVLTSQANSHIHKAIQEGANKIILINPTRRQKKDVPFFLYHIWLHFQKYKAQLDKEKKRVQGYKPPKNISLFTIQPEKEIPATTFNNSKKALEKSVEQGYQETLVNKQLAQFLKE